MKIKSLKLMLGLSVFIAGSVSAETWCNGGTIVNVATVNWTGTVNENIAGNIIVPPGNNDPERYQAQHAAANYCSTYKGGGGPTFGPVVTGAGSVSTIITGPFTYTNTTNNYELYMGLNFECKKCYSIPPYKEIFELKIVKPLPGTEGNAEYERVIEKR
ncbi:hypothetical protein [Marinicella gelatinilytica]|uniref:hypothetical protein n=1 Tax=Marinicella gelatinilytica TaxID=2996017 RepID=UPI002260F092|nr:hypothetical protein [Marinicella gelatinilytica]MCX7545819.1 hypothetical protein [Marinicella gelatinilytica]